MEVVEACNCLRPLALGVAGSWRPVTGVRCLCPALPQAVRLHQESAADAARWDPDPLAVILLLVSLALVIYVLAGSEGPRRAEVTVFEEDALPKMYMPRDERAPDRPVWLSDYSSHLPLLSIPPALPSENLDPVVDLQAQALMDSLSPGVRAHYEGAHPSREAVRKREHEREEAEYAVFIEERMRRLSEVEGR